MRFPPLSRRARRLTLVLHVAVSVGWLGMDAVLLVLGATAALTDDPELTRACVVAMDAAGGVMLIPVSLLALLSGVVLGLGTKWGLVRHWWVLVKLAVTLVAATLSIVALRAELAAAAGAPPAELDAQKLDLVIPPTVALVLYVTMTAVSILKPWGRTRWGRTTQATTRPDPAPSGTTRPEPAPSGTTSSGTAPSSTAPSSTAPSSTAPSSTAPSSTAPSSTAPSSTGRVGAGRVSARVGSAG